MPSYPRRQGAVTADDPHQGALKQVKYPGFSRDIVSFGLVRSAAFADGTARRSRSPHHLDPKVPLHLKSEVDKCLRALPGVKDTIIEIAVAPPRPPRRGPAARPAGRAQGIKHSVAIASGKGGVGKSTFAVNLACALAQVLEAAGRPGRVGPDGLRHLRPQRAADDGPAAAGPEIDGESLVPMLERHGVKVMSMGFLVDDNTPSSGAAR
jgi:ATP-binding protein involved in chromosome partitioning